MTHIPPEQQFGTKTVWKKQKKVSVSDPTRTIVDMLSCPWAGDGIQHVIDCFSEYARSPHFKVDLLLNYADRLGNAVVFKRLRFLAERLLGESRARDESFTKVLPRFPANIRCRVSNWTFHRTKSWLSIWS